MSLESDAAKLLVALIKIGRFVATETSVETMKRNLSINYLLSLRAEGSDGLSKLYNVQVITDPVVLRFKSSSQLKKRQGDQTES